MLDKNISDLVNGLRELNDIELQEVLSQVPTDTVRPEIINNSQQADSINLIELKPDANIKPRDFVIQDVVPQGFPAAIYGGGGKGKSYLAMLAAICVAAGIPFLGKEVIQGNVTYLDYELDECEQQRRLAQIANGVRVDWNSIEGRIHYCKPNTPIDLLVPHIIEENKRRNVKLTIVDSIRFAARGNLQDDEVASNLINQVCQLGTVLLIAHQAKPQSKPGKISNDDYDYDSKTIFGSVFLTNGCRSIWQVQNKNGILTLTHKKCNFTNQQPNIKARMQFAGDALIFDTTVEEKPARKKETIKDKAYQAVKELGKASAKEVHQYLTDMGAKAKPGTVQNELNDLVKEKKLEVVDKDGNANIYTATSHHQRKPKK